MVSQVHLQLRAVKRPIVSPSSGKNTLNLIHYSATVLAEEMHISFYQFNVWRVS